MTTPSDARRRTIDLQQRAFRFSCGVLTACPKHTSDIASGVVWRQLVRSANSVANNLEEADEASSDADFVHKMKLALREAKESRLSLQTLRVCGLAGGERAEPLEREAGELAAIFATIVIKVRARLSKAKHQHPL